MPSRASASQATSRLTVGDEHAGAVELRRRVADLRAAGGQLVEGLAGDEPLQHDAQFALDERAAQERVGEPALQSPGAGRVSHGGNGEDAPCAGRP